MKNKIAVLMHPHYGGTITKEFGEIYVNALKTYETSIVYLPKIDNEIAKEIIIENIDILLDYYFDNKTNEYLHNYFGIPTIPYFINLVESVFKIPKTIFKIKNKTYIKKFDNRNKKKYLRDKILSNIDLILKAVPKFTSIISGVKDFTIHNEDLINNLESRLEKEKDVFIYSLGGVGIIQEYSKFIYGEINRETEIDIFGEYANQCIQHHKNVLEKLGFKVNIIKHLSVYTEHGEVFKGYIKNDDDKYLHIIKKENLC